MSKIKRSTAIFLFLQIFMMIMNAQADTLITKDKIKNNDTTFIKLVDDKIPKKDWDVIFPYVIGGLITGLFTLLAVFLTLNQQRNVTQSQIDVETKRKFIDDLLEILKRVNLIIFETFKISHEVLGNIPKSMKSKEEIEECRSKIELAMIKMSDKSLELLYWSGTVLLYIPITHSEYKNLERLSRKLSKSYSYYYLYFKGSEIPIKEKENKLGDILQKRLEYYSDKIKELIDVERNNIDHIFKKTKNKN